MTSQQTCKRYPLIADISVDLAELYGLVAIPAVLAKMKELKPDGDTRGSTFKKCLTFRGEKKKHDDLALRILRYEFQFDVLAKLEDPAARIPDALPPVNANTTVSTATDAAIVDCFQTVTAHFTKATQELSKNTQETARVLQQTASSVSALTDRVEKTEGKVEEHTEQLTEVKAKLSQLQEELVVVRRNTNTGANSNVAPAHERVDHEDLICGDLQELNLTEAEGEDSVELLMLTSEFFDMNLDEDGNLVSSAEGGLDDVFPSLLA